MTVYFDMDGVLADFEGGVRKLCGIEPKKQGVFDPQKDDEMFEAIHRVENFYNRLEPLPGAVGLFLEVLARHGDDCRILTGIPRPERGIVNAAQHKADWAHRVISPDAQVIGVRRKDKPDYCTGPDCILIDDHPGNIKQWNRAGGTGILHKDIESTRAALRELGVL